MASRYMILALAGLTVMLAGCSSVQPQPETPEIVSPETQTPDLAGGALVQDGFAVLDFRALRDQYDQVHVVGEVRNVSEAARGVELQATLRDAAGRVVSVGNFYPASNHNIAPGEAWPFAYSFGRQPSGVRAELRIVSTFRTIETVGIIR